MLSRAAVLYVMLGIIMPYMCSLTLRVIEFLRKNDSC